MSAEKDIVITDIEDFDEVDVIEVYVAPGDSIEVNQSIVALESDKAMMEFPSSDAGVVKKINVTVGDKVKQGDVLMVLEVENKKEAIIKEEEASKTDVTEKNQEKKQQKKNNKPGEKSTSSNASKNRNGVYASPAVRKYASELGVVLEQVTGSAENGRILKKDIQSHVQRHVSATGGENIIRQHPMPDFSKFGDIEEIQLNKLKQVSAKHLHHSWNAAPHVTQFDDADITELEFARKQIKAKLQSEGVKLTLLPFIMKALVKCLQEYPDFNSSLNHNVTALLHKKYYHIGIAVDTPRGLVVPVIKDVDKKKISDLAKELMSVSSRARENKLTPKDMQGGCMTITSLGGIGGKYFTPIINLPEVAILGISRSYPVLIKKNEQENDERLMLPMSLTYDHRAIDGVAGANFTTSLKDKLSDVWTLMI